MEGPREGVEDAVGWLHEWGEERGLYLGPEVNTPQGDGKKMDYPLAVENLLEPG